MAKLSKEQKILNLKKAFKGRGYEHNFIRKVQGDILYGDKIQTKDYVIASYCKDSIVADKKQLRILSGTETTKRTSNGRLISKHEPYEWFITKEDAENLICFLEAYIEVEKQKESA
tara:strand:- start:843 stop:1190 length:348 start_codon:yes stop_codon:yes gene_type:complete